MVVVSLPPPYCARALRNPHHTLMPMAIGTDVLNPLPHTPESAAAQNLPSKSSNSKTAIVNQQKTLYNGQMHQQQ